VALYILVNLILSIPSEEDVFHHPLYMKEGTGQTSDFIKRDAELLNEMSKEQGRGSKQ
jgi:hypothetical protein